MQSSLVRNEIENTINLYALGYDDGDMALVENTLTPDAVLSMRVADGDLVGPFEGRQAIMELFRSASHSQQDQQRRHVTSNIIIDAEDDWARSVAYVTIFAAANGTVTAVSTGKYVDELVRTPQGWKFRKRHIALDLPY